MTYQTQNAGNQGDVVKHPALLALLTATFSSGPGPFLFADAYAGHAFYRLPPSGGWQSGIGKFDMAGVAHLPPTSAVRSWSGRYLPVALGSASPTYPGSCSIAEDEARAKGVCLQIAAWDTSPAAVKHLRSHLNRARAHQMPASVTHADIQQADRLFVDPWSPRDWSKVKLLMDSRARNALVWMPMYPVGSGSAKGVHRTPTMRAEARGSEKIRREALALGYNVTRVRWDFNPTSTRDMIGCQLIFNVGLGCGGVSAVRSAVDEAAASMGWRSTDPRDPVVAHS